LQDNLQINKVAKDPAQSMTVDPLTPTNGYIDSLIVDAGIGVFLFPFSFPSHFAVFTSLTPDTTTTTTITTITI
jgi:hypothetical protein